VNVSPRLGLDFHWTEHVMTYVSYSRGFKSGGFDMRGNAAVYPQTENGYKSETADNYEAGIKSTLFDDTLLLNLTAFYDPYKNAQIQLQDFVEYQGAPTNLTAVLNAGKQINQGLELEAVWRPLKPLTLGFNVGYLDSYYKDFLVPCNPFTFQPGCGPGVTTVNAEDSNRPINAPTWTASANAAYTWDLSSGSLLAQLHQGREYDSKRDRSAGVWSAQRRPRVHHDQQGVALLDRREEPDRSLVSRGRI
jgi:iron complex outermembrane receptor protein